MKKIIIFIVCIIAICSTLIICSTAETKTVSLEQSQYTNKTVGLSTNHYYYHFGDYSSNYTSWASLTSYLPTNATSAYAKTTIDLTDISESHYSSSTTINSHKIDSGAALYNGYRYTDVVTYYSQNNLGDSFTYTLVDD